MKVDVAVQSYRKPEQLLLSLLSLRSNSAHRVDQVYINDDRSPPWVTEFYNSDEFRAALVPWRVNVRRNRRRMGWWYAPVCGYRSSYRPVAAALAQRLRFAWRSRAWCAMRQDLRYQWAIDSTDKPLLFLMHDDVIFHDDVISEYVTAASRCERPAIIGELGQCWRCPLAAAGCTPQVVLARKCPASAWPAVHASRRHRWVCRINEWCALIVVQAARDIESRHQVLFGNFDDHSDVGAYWFARAVGDGYGFDDPLPAPRRDAFYAHAVGGSGHSVWVDQGLGRRPYDATAVRQTLRERHGFEWPARWAHA